MNDFLVKSVIFDTSLSIEEREVLHKVTSRLVKTPNEHYSINNAIEYVTRELDCKDIGMILNKPNMICWAWVKVVDKLYGLYAVKQEVLDSILQFLFSVSCDTEKGDVLRNVLTIKLAQ